VVSVVILEEAPACGVPQQALCSVRVAQGDARHFRVDEKRYPFAPPPDEKDALAVVVCRW
jgi:hypothetical protein